VPLSNSKELKQTHFDFLTNAVARRTQKKPAIAGQNPPANMPLEEVLKQAGWLAIDHDSNQP
jgi:hypothetical protein